jgi:hydrogenase maturation protein HypF
MFDPDDRRYNYPFLSTNCGPRLTIIHPAPDHERTTMAEFHLCPACRAEYDDERPFHAQPRVLCDRG